MTKRIPLFGSPLAELHQNPSSMFRVNRVEMKACTFKLAGRNYAGECGTITVPETWDKPPARTITLPIKRIRAANPTPAEPVFYLAGGPGISNMGFRPPVELLKDHDFVLVGYRGVDVSVVLDCPEVNRAMKGVGGHLLSEASRKAFGEAIRRCAQRCADRGVDLSGYTIPAVIKDLEAAREALGYPRIHLLSQSYGTRIALLYAQQHPDRIFRSVMIGVNPPGRFVWEPKKVDEQLGHYSQLYARQRPDADKTRLVEAIRRVNQRMPDHWLFFRIDPGKVKAASFAMLFNRKTAASVFDAYLAASNGDASGLAPLPDRMAFGASFPFLPPASRCLHRRVSGGALMRLPVLSSLHILLHGFFVTQLSFAKHLPRPAAPIFASRPRLNHQVAGRPADRGQHLLGEMLFRNEAQVDVEGLARLFSRPGRCFRSFFFLPNRCLAKDRRL